MKKTKSKQKTEEHSVTKINFSNIEKVLFIRIRSLGDCLLMTPCLRILKNAYPHIKTAVLVEEPFKDIFLDNPFIDELWIMRKGLGAFDTMLERLVMAFRIKKEGYDLILNFHGGSTSLLFTRLSGATFKAGFSRYRGIKSYTHLVDKPEQFFNTENIHTVQYQAALLAGLGIELPGSIPTPEIYIPDEVHEKTRIRLSENGLKKYDYFIIHPTATLETKRWPSEHFAQLIKMIEDKYSERIILTCGPGEEWIVEEILQNLKKPLLFFSTLSVKELASLIHFSKAFIGCDSGPAHIASALAKPVCVIFGSSNPTAWRPWGTENYRIVRLPLPCSPCAGYRCSEFSQPKCILDIKPDTVFKNFSNLLG